MLSGTMEDGWESYLQEGNYAVNSELVFAALFNNQFFWGQIGPNQFNFGDSVALSILNGGTEGLIDSAVWGHVKGLTIDGNPVDFIRVATGEFKKAPLWLIFRKTNLAFVASCVRG